MDGQFIIRVFILVRVRMSSDAVPAPVTTFVRRPVNSARPRKGGSPGTDSTPWSDGKEGWVGYPLGLVWLSLFFDERAVGKSTGRRLFFMPFSKEKTVFLYSAGVESYRLYLYLQAIITKRPLHNSWTTE